MKRAIALILSVILVSCAVPMTSGAASSGTIGNLTWTMTSYGVLTISGKGKMRDFTNVSGSTSPWARGKLEKVIIENGVESIGDHAFNTCTKLASVTIPDSVTRIGNYAFEYCALTSVTLPDSVTSIGSCAFYSCKKLADITIPAGVTSVGGSAFKDTAWLKNQPDGVVYVGQVAYQYKGAMPDRTEIVLNDGIKEISTYAFSGCTGLAGVTIPDSVTSIGRSAFQGCTGLMDVTVPDGVTTIGSHTFYGCADLTAVTIPDSVKNIESEAFHGCKKLTKVNIGSLTGWCGITFGNQYANPLLYAHHLYLNGSEITDLVIPDGVVSLRTNAFRGCTGLTSLTIPDSVTHIRSNVFYDCSGLMTVTIPDSVISIGNNAFYGCTSLASMVIGSGVNNIGTGMLTGCDPTIFGYAGSYVQKYAEDLGYTFREIGQCDGDHRWDAGTVTKAASCKETGVKTYVCSVCGMPKIEIIAATNNHTWNDGEIITAPTYAKDGVMTFTCTVCGATKTEAIPKTEPKTAPGDVDGDGKVTSADARLALRASVGLKEPGDVEKDSAAYLACDVDGDGKVTSADARLILRASVGLETLT